MDIDIINLLKDPIQPKWLTSSKISAKINKYDALIVEKMLIDYYKNNPNCEFRYSSLPSKRNLEVLWGHIDKVGNRPLFDIFKEDHVNTDYLNVSIEDRNLFLSYSFKDTDHVFSLTRNLISQQLYPWIAELDLHYGEHINNKIIDAIKSLPYYGIYLSKNVLQSTWSAKEFEFAIRNKRKLYAYINENDKEIIDLIKNKPTDSSLDIHDLLRRIFDQHAFSDQMEFYLVSTNDDRNLFKRIK